MHNFGKKFFESLCKMPKGIFLKRLDFRENAIVASAYDASLDSCLFPRAVLGKFLTPAFIKPIYSHLAIINIICFITKLIKICFNKINDFDFFFGKYSEKSQLSRLEIMQFQKARIGILRNLTLIACFFFWN